MSLPDRRRFLRHLRPWWDVHRHRMAGAVADRVDAAKASGQLRGFRLAGSRLCNSGMAWSMYCIVPRGRDSLDTIRVARVVNCSGPGADYRDPEPLIRSLLGQGIVRPDPLKLGLDVTAHCALLDPNGAISRRLFAVGPVTKGAFWEMTAVPDIRRQTELVAEYLAGLVRTAAPTTVSYSGEQRN